jgi:TRAP-type C4-dicarboxylate transport system permease large subunit
MLVATITQLDYWSLCKRIIPFVIVEVLVLALMVLFPELSLALPRWLGML